MINMQMINSITPHSRQLISKGTTLLTGLCVHLYFLLIYSLLAREKQKAVERIHAGEIMEFYDFESAKRTVTFRDWYKRKCRTATSSKFWLRRFPVINWIKSYSWTSAFYDVVAGVTVGLLVLPHCLAAAIVAGLPPQVINLTFANLNPFLPKKQLK